MPVKPDQKELLLKAAEKLFAVKGFEGVSVRDICNEANVNVAMVNYYFRSKEGLFESLVAHNAGYMKQRLKEMLKEPNYAPLQKLDCIIESYVERFFLHRHFVLTIFRELSVQQRGSVRADMVKILLGNMRIVEMVIEEGVKKKIFRKVDIPLTLASFIGTINQILLNEEMVKKMIRSPQKYKPFEDDEFKQRIIHHLKSMLHRHLL